MNVYELYNGMKIPAIGLGTFPYKEKLEESIPIAVNKGYRLIDTSDNYGNEINVGHAFQKLDKDKRADDIIIITKYSKPSLTMFFSKMFKKSQMALYNSDSHPVDIYLLHWPYPFLWKKQWKKMEKLYEEGKCKAIGVCNFEKKHLEELFKICKIKPMIDQFECHPMFQQREMVQFCKENNIQVMSYSPFARMDKRLVENSKLCELASKYNKSVQQIILRWNIQKGLIPIPASVTEKHLESNINVFDFVLLEEEMKAIDDLECGMRVRFDPDTRFPTWYKIVFFICSIFC